MVPMHPQIIRENILKKNFYKERFYDRENSIYGELTKYY